MASWWLKWAWTEAQYCICLNVDAGLHMSAVGTHQDKKFNFLLCLVERNCEGHRRHIIISCFSSWLISFPHRFVKSLISRLVWGKSLHMSRNSVISLLATLHLCNQNLLAASCQRGTVSGILISNECMAQWWFKWAWTQALYWICVYIDVGLNLSTVATHQDKKWNFLLCLVDGNCEGKRRHTTISCFYSGLISFPHRFVKLGITRLVWGKSLHTSRNSVISLLHTLHVSRTYQLRHVNVVLLLAEFSNPRIVWHCDASCDHEY